MLQGRPERNPAPSHLGQFWASSDDGKYFASVVLEGGFWAAGNATDFLSGGKYVLHLFDTAAGTEVRKWEVGIHEWGAGEVGFPRFFNQGKSIHLNGKGGIEVFNAAQGKKSLSVAAKSDVRVAAVTSSNGSVFIGADNDPNKKTGRAVAWDVKGKQAHLFDGGQGTISALAVAPGGDLLATGGEDGTILLWKLPK